MVALFRARLLLFILWMWFELFFELFFVNQSTPFPKYCCAVPADGLGSQCYDLTLWFDLNFVGESTGPIFASEVYAMTYINDLTWLLFLANQSTPFLVLLYQRMASGDVCM